MRAGAAEYATGGSPLVHERHPRPLRPPGKASEQVASLGALTTPTLDFPAPFLGMAAVIQAGRTTVNGEPSQLSPFGVTKKGDRD